MSGVDLAAVKALQLSAVVGQSIKLRRSGREYVGCCPFHHERTPSFTVSNEKGFAHCFGCGWHGDAADFVAGIAGCGLREAAERLGAGDLPVVERSEPTHLPEPHTAKLQSASGVKRNRSKAALRRIICGCGAFTLRFRRRFGSLAFAIPRAGFIRAWSRWRSHRSASSLESSGRISLMGGARPLSGR